ncbi:MAG TPA: RNA repair transcriptional activator RtcR family protein, partial [Kofleriaceae bacterium]|nr:RNA repair transcriptional activator RtcR family protein [Kofleriaceae bacterium]
MARKTVVIGMLGTTLDAGHTEGRWRRWRPSVAICQQPELPIDRFELLVVGDAPRLTLQVVDDIAKVAPDVAVRAQPLAVADPWDFSEVYAAFDRYAEAYPWRTASEDYYVHITTGTHVMQICLFLLCETRAMPAVLLQSSPAPRDPAAQRRPAGRVDVIDLELAKYD